MEKTIDGKTAGVSVFAGGIVIFRGTYVLIIAGGIGSRLVGIGSNDVPKQFTICNEQGETWIQVTVKRFLALGIPARNIIVITTNEGQTELAKDQLLPLKVFEHHIHQIGSNYDYAGAMVKGAEFIKSIDRDAVVINTPSDQYIVADDNFKATMRSAVESAASGVPTIVGVRTTDLNLIRGCGHAIYQAEDLGQTKKVVSFVEKPDLEKAQDLLNSENSALNTGINVWRIQDLFEQSKDLIASKRRDDLNKVIAVLDEQDRTYGKVITLEEAAKRTKEVQREVGGWSMSTDELMLVFDNLHVAIGNFAWADCGTYDSLYKVLNKTADKNAKIGLGDSEARDCSGSLFYTADGYWTKPFGLRNAFMAVNKIYGRTVVVIGDMKYCQLVKEFGEKLGADAITGHSYSIESKNCHVQQTEVDLIVCFVGLSNHSVAAINGRDGEIIVSVSNDSYVKAA